MKAQKDKCRGVHKEQGKMLIAFKNLVEDLQVMKKYKFTTIFRKKNNKDTTGVCKDQEKNEICPQLN